jgi:hypothetical protein
MARLRRALRLAVAALALSGCAAMKRTWAFSEPTVTGPQLRVEARETLVTQKDVWLELEVKNVSGTPLDVDMETFVLTLPDGEEVLGYVDYMTRKKEQLSGVVRRNDDDPPLQPGQHLRIQLNFHQYGRDYRRLPTLIVDLSGILVDGVSADVPPLVLEAPANAPMGEHI